MEAPVLVVATPAGQLHELGAVMVAAAAADAGWNVVYLGTSLPAAEIAGAAIQNRAKAVALSIVYPADDPNLPTELENLRRYLPPTTHILAGGRSAAAYDEVLDQAGARWTDDLTEVYRWLDELRRPGRKEVSKSK
jgi:methylmalonyl-CoA mutase cobalamin-binding domain/chain